MKLNEYQDLVQRLCTERDFDNDSVEESYLLLVEEIGELAKAIRQNHSRLQNGQHSDTYNIEDELADVFWLLLAVANKLGVDLETAFQNKELKNKQRFQ